ncbi:N-acetyltransferase 9-like protein isoform X2 [Mercenaria mercenaria]|uniref:N-acetyltransferase 9-like protein isoform X2 n=1 Tax=Mercenaria mercenaria TaxID=6596 RepID=UPI00234E87DF|nr:N-acetyltransferase 9-like protein isoform X2 [Mercenaria mercenaria]
MKCNANTKITGCKLILVPYEKEHVLRYHEWMKSEELQTLTASEPLNLEEEYQMQQSWREDDNKCTFIVLDKEKYEENGNNEIDGMVGDVNLFLNDEDNPSTAEIEIMIAEPAARGKGLGKEAVYCMMRYGIEELKLTHITAKIGYSNKPSIKMFMNIGFQEKLFSSIIFVIGRHIDDVISGSSCGPQKRYIHIDFV